MVHIQYPVGQGGLHLGIIGNVAYIYDCGGKGKNVDWQGIFDDIKIKLQNCESLYVFISHLHWDHCNKLQELLKLSNAVKALHIYAPCMSNATQVKLLLEYDGDDSSYEWYYNAVVNSVVSKSDTEKIRVDHIGNNKKCFDVAKGWYLWPYMTEQSDDQEQTFKQMLADAGITLDDLSKRVSPGWEKAKKIYENVYRKLHEAGIKPTNDVMLCLYCGPKEPPCETGCLLTNTSKQDWLVVLHTGDANLAGDNLLKLKAHYGIVLDCVNVLQIPHHGASSCHDSCFTHLLHPFNLFPLLFYTIGGGSAKVAISDIFVHPACIRNVSENPGTKITLVNERILL